MSVSVGSLSTRVLVLNETPPSLNRLGMRGDPRQAQRLKKRWQYDLGILLLAKRFPRDLVFVEAFAELRFPTRRRRDAGNHSWLLDKALGDVLQDGWIPDDTPDFYRWKGVTFDAERGPARTVITVTGRHA